MIPWRRAVIVCLPLLAAAAPQTRTSSQAVSTITSPAQEFGAAIGDDYFLATYTQLERYWQKLDRESDRVQLVDIGRTEEGRPQWMAVVSSPQNIQHIDRYRDLSRQLALAEGLSDDQARALAHEGRSVVWIDGGLHADEVLGPQQLIELVYQLASGADAETERILRDVIVLAAHPNPDGHELVAGWYMREKEPLRRTLDGIPRLYQKYVGHDLNRDFYMSTQAETININRVLYRQWFPQIVLDHHQAAPSGTVMFAPPFREPSNYVFDPLIPAGIELAGAAMHARFAAERKPGVTMRSGSTYSNWWNGGLRTSAYFHNQIGLLTETIGGPAPTEIPRVPAMLVATADLPSPIAPQPWRFRQSLDYVMSANRAVLDLASRYRETLLFNAYRMGKNSIERGNEDSWTMTPRRQRRDMAARDARAYVLPSDQPDFLTATKFVDALLKSGITVHRAVAPFAAARTRYPAGSYVVKTAQAFRPHVLDMFEPQDHPDDIPYPGARPTPPYDSAGWTLAFQMGVRFDRVLDGLEGPFERVDRVTPPPGRVVPAPGAAGYLVSHHQNDAFIAVNRLLSAGARVSWPGDRSANAMFVGADAAAGPQGRTRPTVGQSGTRPTVDAIVGKAAADLGLTFTAVAREPAGESLRLRPVRLALWDRTGGAVSSGWIRWLLERYEFPFEIVSTGVLASDDLSERFDAVILPDEATFAGRASAREPGGAAAAQRLRQFVESGGTLITMGRSTSIGETFGVVRSALVERQADGSTRPLPREKYYVPGSVMRLSVDNATPLGYGFDPNVDVFFDNSPVFTLTAPGRVAWFASAAPLRSGWAWGQQHLEGGVAVADVTMGRGRLVLFGPEVTFRAQSHGTFKFLFNAILVARAEPSTMR